PAPLAGVAPPPLLPRIRLQAVAGHLVKSDAAETTADDHGHLARRRGVRVEQRERLAGRLLGNPRRIAFEQLEAAMGAQGLEARPHGAVPAGDDLGAEPDAGAVVARRQPLGVEDREAPPTLPKRRR